MNNKITSIVAIAIALGIYSSSCKKGATIGAVGYPMTDKYEEFDTFNFPTKRYYFYGKFDGVFRLWQDSTRSKWDTITRDPFGQPEETVWSEWPVYTDNIYYNFCSQREVSDCRYDSSNSYYEHKTRFIRPDFPDERIEVNFYNCVDLTDTNNIDYPFNERGLVMVGANPFTDIPFGRFGAQVVYRDPNGDRWKTKAGSGQLDDTYIRITDYFARDIATDTLDTFGLYVVEGEFAGRLFKENGTEEKIVTEAKFRARLIPREQP